MNINPLDYDAWIYKQARKFTRCPERVKDYAQEGYMAILERQHGWDPGKGAFLTYMTPWIIHYMQMHHAHMANIVHVSRWKHGTISSLQLLENEQEDQQDTISNEQVRQAIAQHRRPQLFALRLRGFNYREIAEMEGMSQERVRQLM